MGKKRFYPSHWKRRVIFVVVKKSGQPRLGFVHKQKRYEDACVPKPERLSMPCSFDGPVTLCHCHGIATSRHAHLSASLARSVVWMTTVWMWMELLHCTAPAHRRYLTPIFAFQCNKTPPSRHSSLLSAGRLIDQLSLERHTVSMNVLFTEHDRCGPCPNSDPRH